VLQLFAADAGRQLADNLQCQRAIQAEIGKIGQRPRLQRLAPREIVPGQRRELLLQQRTQAAQFLADRAIRASRFRTGKYIGEQRLLVDRTQHRRCAFHARSDARIFTLQILQCGAPELLQLGGFGQRALARRQFQVHGRADLDPLRRRATAQDDRVGSLFFADGPQRIAHVGRKVTFDLHLRLHLRT
jgi:hypothetical protein